MDNLNLIYYRTTIIILASITLSSLCFFTYKRIGEWQEVIPEKLPEKRHENAFVKAGNQFYLLGGRKKLLMEAYDPKLNKWEKKADLPLEMHHFQAVEFNGEIYVLGAFTGNFPHETPIPKIYIYNPSANKWREGAEIPENRRRGAAGVTVYRNKIYLVCGIQDGHYDGHVTWLDEFDPKTNKWKTLADAPRARDHVQAAVVNGQMVIAGGRRSTHKTGHVLDLTEPKVDIYDFKTNTWKTLPESLNLPTQRAGCTSVAVGDKVVVIGGESPQKLAHNQTEAFNLKTNSWEVLPSLKTGRHGTQAILHNNQLFIAAGSENQGGGPELNSMERLELEK